MEHVSTILGTFKVRVRRRNLSHSNGKVRFIVRTKAHTGNRSTQRASTALVRRVGFMLRRTALGSDAFLTTFSIKRSEISGLIRPLGISQIPSSMSFKPARKL